jgi:DNA-directed RNA polymerase subunit RPC12/RpoP
MPPCSSCGEAADEASPGRDSCPRCGGNLARSADDFIASWVMPPDPPEPQRAEDVECRTCGYSGEMGTVDDHLVCPACGAWNSIPRVEDTPAEAPVEDAPRVAQVVECPTCGRAIEVHDVEAGKSVICTLCNSFLGCLKKKENRPWWLRGLLKGI